MAGRLPPSPPPNAHISISGCAPPAFLTCAHDHMPSCAKGSSPRLFSVQCKHSLKSKFQRCRKTCQSQLHSKRWKHPYAQPPTCQPPGMANELTGVRMDAKRDCTYVRHCSTLTRAVPSFFYFKKRRRKNRRGTSTSDVNRSRVHFV